MADRWERERPQDREPERFRNSGGRDYDRWGGDYDRDNSGHQQTRERRWEGDGMQEDRARGSYSSPYEYSQSGGDRGSFEGNRDQGSGGQYGDQDRGREHQDRGWWGRTKEAVRDAFSQDQSGEQHPDAQRNWSNEFYRGANREEPSRSERGYVAGGAAALGGYGVPSAPGGPATQSPAGRFAGRGPKNYRRSDERITEEVCEHLTRNPDVDASEITVHVENGVVTLSGTVEDRHARRAAEDAVCDLWGVSDVRNELRVNAQSRGGFPGRGEQERGPDRR